MEFAAIIASISLASLTVTKAVDTMRNMFDKNASAPKWVWNVLSIVVGLVFALGWQVDLTGAVLKIIPALSSARLNGVAGQVLTGITVGLAAGFWHEVLDALSSSAKANRARASAATPVGTQS